jgi:hypothetical protein
MQVRPDLVQRRDEKYKISTEELRESRVDIQEPETHPNADYWVRHNKGFAIDISPTEMKRTAPFP